MKIFYIISIIVGIIIFIISSITIYQIYNADETRIIFLDIGQGDSILITEGEYQILIDGGADSKILQEKLGKYMPFWDRTIDVVIATHLDDDHVSGLVDIFNNYEVYKFWYSKIEKNTITAHALKANISEFNIQTHEPVFGDKIKFPSGANFHIVYPIIRNEIYNNLEDLNATSITGIFEVNNEKFFLGGDLPSKIEDRLDVNNNITVLKAGHHGSKTSTSQLFLDKIKPRDVIISAGKNNTYGHPHHDIIKRLIMGKMRIFKTYEDGDIIYTCTDKCVISFN